MPTLFQITGLSVGGAITIAVGVTLARMVGQIYDVTIQKRFEKFLTSLPRSSYPETEGLGYG
jgi:hypothetical protein